MVNKDQPPLSQGEDFQPPPSPNGSSNSSDGSGSPIEFDLSHLTTQPEGEKVDTTTATTLEKENVKDLSEVPEAKLGEFEKHLREVLSSRKKENRKVGDRRKLLFDFVWNFSRTTNSPHLRDFFHHSLAQHPIIQSLNDNLMQRRVRKHDCSNDYIASQLFKLHHLVTKSDQAHKDCPENRPRRSSVKEAEPLVNFRSFIAGIKQRYDDDRLAQKVKSQRRISSAPPKSHPMFHDDFARARPGWRKEIFSTPCPGCGHNSLVKYDKDEEVYEQVSKLRGIFTEANLRYARLTPSAQAVTKKPKNPVYPKQRMICMCLLY